MWQMTSSKPSTTTNMISNDNHILYHGATAEVREPLTHVGRPELDFGPGFYLTNDKQQAIDWANTKAGRKKGLKAVLNVYRFDLDGFLANTDYHHQVFLEYNIEWLDFIADSRKGKQPWKGLDWIEGGIANDSVISTVDAYVDGYMPAEMALGKLVKEELKHQVCISNQTIIDQYLTFLESIKL